MHGLNQNADITAQNLQQNLVDLPMVGLRPDRVAKLALYHAEGCFDVGPPVVMGAPLNLVQGEVGIKSRPPGRTPARGVGLERDVRTGTVFLDVPQVGVRKISFVSGHPGHREPFCGVVQQPGQYRGVVGGAGGDLNRRNDVGLSPRHDMGLEPLPLRPLLAPLSIVPPVEPAGGEPGAVGGKLRLHYSKGFRAPLNQSLDDRGQVRIGDVTVDRVERRGGRDESLAVGSRTSESNRLAENPP